MSLNVIFDLSIIITDWSSQLNPKNSLTFSSLGLPSLWRAVDWQPRTWCPITVGDIQCHLLGWGLSLIFSLLALGLSLVPAIPVSAHSNGRFARTNLSYWIYFTYVNEGSSCSNIFQCVLQTAPALLLPSPEIAACTRVVLLSSSSVCSGSISSLGSDLHWLKQIRNMSAHG